MTSVQSFASETQKDTVVTLELSGSDEGAGMKGFNVYVKQNSGPYVLVAQNYPGSSITMHANYGDTLSFYTFAEDSLGNVERKPLHAEAQLIIEEQENSVIENQWEEWCKIYPNPAKETLYIESSSHFLIKQVHLYDISGNMVYSQNGKVKYLDLTSLRTGVYIIEIHHESGIYHEKILIED
jgi:hypothetical protein